MAFTIVQAQGAARLYIGLSTDAKPTAVSATGQSPLQAGARLYEFDTRRTYTWDGAAWQLRDSSHEETTEQGRLLEELVILARLQFEELTAIRILLAS